MANAQNRPMQIAIMGAGNVGGGLGAGLAAAGHAVTYGVRDPESEKTRAALAATLGGRAASPADAVNDADAVIFALRWDAVADTVGQHQGARGDGQNLARPRCATWPQHRLHAGAGLTAGARALRSP